MSNSRVYFSPVLDASCIAARDAAAECDRIAERWERGRYGDKGLRLWAEDTARVMRQAAALLRAKVIDG